MKRITLASASLAAIAALSFPLVAHADHHGHRGGGHGGMEAHMAELDTNGDGDISKAEIEAHRAAMFAEADTNSDGALSPEEMIAHHEAKMAERKAKMQARMFAKMDADGDGAISVEEFDSRPMRGFDRLDADDDGVITEEERAAAKSRWEERRGKWHKRSGAPDAEPTE